MVLGPNSDFGSAPGFRAKPFDVREILGASASCAVQGQSHRLVDRRRSALVTRHGCDLRDSLQELEHILWTCLACTLLEEFA